MKLKIFYFFLTALLIVACNKSGEKKNEASEEITVPNSEKTAKQDDGLIMFTGDFLFYDDAAVLNTGKTIYGVELNDKMRELDSLVRPFKKDPTDMINVGVRGKLIPKPQNTEGWDFTIEIKEIVDVYPVLQVENHS